MNTSAPSRSALVPGPHSPCTVSLQSAITMLLKNVGEPGTCKGCREADLLGGTSQRKEDAVYSGRAEPLC